MVAAAAAAAAMLVAAAAATAGRMAVGHAIHERFIAVDRSLIWSIHFFLNINNKLIYIYGYIL